MGAEIHATVLYNLVQCPHRVTMDRFGNPAQKVPVSGLIQLLWERGNAYEQKVIESLRLPFVNLRPLADDEREKLSLEAMERGDSLIYGGRIRTDDLLGEPDLLRRQEGGYVAGDIKSGAGEEGGSEDTEGRLKKHYGVQLALYTDILERLNLSANRAPFIWDVHGREVAYDLDAPQNARNPKSLWSEYQSCLKTARRILSRKAETLPALSSICKLCHWRLACTKKLEELDDLTLIPELGRSRRDAMVPYIKGVKDLAEADLDFLLQAKGASIAGISPDLLRKFQGRAKLLIQPGAEPYLREPVSLPCSETELFFDIERDPMMDICYLHGFIERRAGMHLAEQYISFFAEEPTQEAEERAFARAWAYVQSSKPSVIYYYSSYEKTFWRKLQKLYPHIVSEEEMEFLFSCPNSVDLYNNVVRPKTEWPTRDYSIKTLASFLGFRWRDPNPSGAASIEWYHRWLDTGDPAVRKRILEYNEDDCLATKVLLDGIRKLFLL